MKKILPKLKLKQTLFLGTLILLMVSFSSYGQVIFDGSYTPGEYNDGDSIVIDSNANGTCDIHTIYAAIQDEPDTVNGGNNYYLVLGIRNGNNGSAIFRYYFNTIPGEGCVGETHSGTFYPIDSADVVIQIDVSKDNKFAVYNWDESTQSWIEDGDDFATSIGDYAVSDGEFSEIRAPLTGASNITDLCDLGNDGNISLAQYIAFSGGNINSSVCSARNIEFDYNVNGNITGEATYCSGTNTSTILTLTGVNGSVLYWESSTDLNNWTSIGNAGNLTYTTSSTLTQTTYYRAVIISDICPGIQKTTGAAAITIEECCTETVIAGDDFEVCENGMISLDATFSDNLNFASATWVGPNGFTSSSIDTAFIASSTDYSGEYIVTVDYGTNCISFDTIAVLVLPAYTGTDSDVICDSELPYTYGDSTFTAAGTKDVVFSTINGCDSIITFTLDVNPTYTGTDSDVICDSELPYTYGDSTFTAAGTKDVVFSTINGCDSIITFTLDVNPTYTGTDSDVICDSELPYTYGDSTFTAAGTKDVVFSTINGCDLRTPRLLYLQQ